MKRQELKGGVIDFIVQAATDEKLLTGFKGMKSPEELQKFAAEKGFAISGTDCEKLIEGQNAIKEALGTMKCY
jgi:hypothetical protein